jgi:hypothetical protein
MDASAPIFLSFKKNGVGGCGGVRPDLAEKTAGARHRPVRGEERLRAFGCGCGMDRQQESGEMGHELACVKGCATVPAVPHPVLWVALNAAAGDILLLAQVRGRLY